MMKKWFSVLLAGMMTCLCFAGCGNTGSQNDNPSKLVSNGSEICEGSDITTNTALRNLSGKKVEVTVDEKTFTIDLYDNTTANDFYDKLPLTITADDYAGYEEKICRLGSTSLSMENAPAGDNPLIPEVGYYEPGNWVALYYGFIGYWPGKVPLGTIDAESDELKAIPDGSAITFEAIGDDDSNMDSSTTETKSDDTQRSDYTDNTKSDSATTSKPEIGSPDNATDALQTTTYHLNGVDFKMILVEAGTFTMGSDNTNVQFSESPAHKVTLTKDYLMGETEVTEALWGAVMGNSGGSNTHPQTSVTWSEAHTFVERLTVAAHERGLIPEDVSFRLPTEAQWEFAAKGGNLSNGYLYSGSNDIDEVAQTLENTGSSSPVAVKGKAPNELGIYDMSGNAYEWVDDYGGDYTSEDQVDPQNTTVSTQYVKRGGSNYHNFDSEPYLFTSTGRYFYSSTDWTIGLRICLY